MLNASHLAAALRCMFPRQRQAAILVWVDGLSVREAARRMGVHHSTVSELLEGARRRALDVIDEVEQTP